MHAQLESFGGDPMKPLGKRAWVIADGWIPPASTGEDPSLLSHEAACMLNSGDTDAHVQISIYFADREPAGPYAITIPPRRAHHQPLHELTDPEPIPLATDYCVVLRSDAPIVVQHTRLDSRQAANSVFSTIAYCED
jgi:hypothetical protein